MFLLKPWRIDKYKLREVIANFMPKIWLSSVDFPTFGRPTMATVPHLYVLSASLEVCVISLSLSYLEPIDLTPIAQLAVRQRGD
jgi:hypothetical protein